MFSIFFRSLWAKFRRGYYFRLEFAYSASWHHIAARIINRWSKYAPPHPKRMAVEQLFKEERAGDVIRWCYNCGKFVAYEPFDGNRHRCPAGTPERLIAPPAFTGWRESDDWQ